MATNEDGGSLETTITMETAPNATTMYMVQVEPDGNGQYWATVDSTELTFPFDGAYPMSMTLTITGAPGQGNFTGVAHPYTVGLYNEMNADEYFLFHLVNQPQGYSLERESLARSLTHSLTHCLTRALSLFTDTRSHTRSLTHSFTGPLTHSLAFSLCPSFALSLRPSLSLSLFSLLSLLSLSSHSSHCPLTVLPLSSQPSRSTFRCNKTLP
jgi:hypothetical protein